MDIRNLYMAYIILIINIHTNTFISHIVTVLFCMQINLILTLIDQSLA